MSDTDGSALLRRRIGRKMAALRKETGMSQERAAALLQRSPATIHRIEAGDPRVKFRDIEIKAMCELYEASAEDRADLLALGGETRTKGASAWWHDYTNTRLPSWFGLFVRLESSAERIREYGPEAVPGLLQTREYATAVTGLPKGLIDAQDVKRQVDFRMERQRLLVNPRPPHLSVVLGEGAIRRAVGGPQVMAAQLQHLLDVSRSPGVTIRILPFGAGAHGGMTSAFFILEFPNVPGTSEPLEPPLVYVDSLTGALYLDKATEVAAYNLAWDDVTSRALDEASSRTLITATMEAFTRG
ncbi:helix-turn-helix transcriptional regulator [Micromonospora sp. WMMD1082]|uniref:helix-turn-helix domain-containing protein n=1 Tax=Micromonospora sp. WMMD1082 TaxID=3016104 RepID=UPI002417BF33|nr:helix-turn-helix transcriptional regulator [Micromonospora sp. WMMD1082]MDG4797644.1 helix-turn-helix transcriptional regulator [Micromonospora sp. WMMD1082]